MKYERSYMFHDGNFTEDDGNFIKYDAEYKKLKESDNLKSKRIMNLESQLRVTQNTLVRQSQFK